ncbi:hypothetical protein GIR35_12360 [Enterococcus faecalis]|nr:hypothetical protein GIR35_12360 [Enterococcus faecalis]
MHGKQAVPWSFIIEFDERKTARNGYDITTLYDYVDKNMERFGNTRIAQGTWKAKEGDEVESQCLALSMLSKTEWVMHNVKTLIAFEDDCDEVDYLDIIRRNNPERLYA